MDKQGLTPTLPKKHRTNHQRHADGKSSSRKHIKSKPDGGKLQSSSVKKEVTTPPKKKPMISETDSEDDIPLSIRKEVKLESAPIYLAPAADHTHSSAGSVKVKTEKRTNQSNGAEIPMAKRKAIPSSTSEATPPIKHAPPSVKTESDPPKVKSAPPTSRISRKRKQSSDNEEEEENNEEEDESAYEEDDSSNDDDDDDFKIPSAKRPKKSTPISRKKKPSTTSKPTPSSKKKATKAAAPKVATPKVATPKVATPKVATPKLTTPKVATPKVATPKTATPKTRAKSNTSSKATIPSKKSATKNQATAGPTKTSSAKGGKKKKEEEKEIRKWWEEEPLPDGIKWRALEHKGPYFAPPYQRLPSDVKFVYDGKPIDLSEKTEEAAGFFAKMLDHDYTTKEIFCKNFFQDWRKEMTEDETSAIKDFKLCDFRAIHTYYKERAEARKNMTKEEKLVIKKENEDLIEKYGWCIIDGHREKIGNFKIEPPGLFRGRGDHPKQGRIKKRIETENVQINIGPDGPIPPPPPGHHWKQVQSDNTVTWLASWTENIQGAIKYVMLSPNSKLKGEKDWAKYEIARRLKSHVDKIRAQYHEDLKSKEMKVRQRAVAVYFIDKLALRAGNEKDSDESADTVGCCSLRVEHIKMHEELDGKEFVIEFDFLGKDSIRYYNRVPVEKQVFKNVRLFMKDKDGGDDLFDRMTTALLNKHLSELMDGLTAKVFRTYNASKTLQEQLYELTIAEDTVPSKMLSYNRANRAVAILCNHQRAPPKTFDQQMMNLQAKIQAKEDAIIETKAEIKSLKKESKTTKDSKITSKLESKQKQLLRLSDQLMKLEVQATDKQENKEIALGTSKLNYLDPRISVAWSKKWTVPIEKIYNKTQRQKFAWAIHMAGEEFEF